MGVGSSGYLWKPQGENTGNGTIILPSKYSGQISSVQVVDSQGNVVDKGDYRHDYENGGSIWDTSKPGGSYGTDTQVQVTLDNGEVVYYGGGGSGRNEGGPIGQGETSGGGSSGGVSNDPGFSNGSGSSDVPGSTGGGQNGFAAGPFYNGKNYPQFTSVDFPTIDPAKFNFTDPQKFAEQFGEFNRGEFKKNFDQSKGFALEALDTELAGLKSFAPAAAALKREQTGLDNRFNQSERSAQVDAVLPNARRDLDAQRSRAGAYAEGRLPDGTLDRALELNIRSRAADNANATGIGTSSLNADKLSDLMSAEERLQISQYGEGLLTNNLATSSSLLLAPTEYSNAGAEISVKPEVGAGRLTYQGAQMLNAATLLDPAQALTSKIQQEQFTTQLEQRTNEFNATGMYDAAKFNSVGSFNAALGKFQYDVSFLNAQQAASQANINAAAAVGFQGLQNDSFNAGLTDAQGQQTIASVSQGIGSIPGAMNAISSVLGSSQGATSSTTSPKSLESTPGIDTSPSQSASQPSTLPQTAPVQMSAPPTASSVDASAPGSYKFAEGVQVPQGYTNLGGNSDSTYSAARDSDYNQELNRFASAHNIPSGSVSVRNAALSDRAVSGATGLSYLPLPHFQPVALAASGKPIYSLPAAASSGNVAVGQNNMTNLALQMATLGVNVPGALEAVAGIGGAASDRDFLNHVDEVSLAKGPEAVASTLLKKILGDTQIDPKTDEGQQVLMTASKIGQVWNGLSPQQKSMAVTALTKPALKIKTGKDIANEKIPSTENAIGGGLTVGDATSFTAQGINGHALARNWNQLSAFGHIATGSKDKGVAARLAANAGLVGFGVQGAAVPVKEGYIRSIGGKPAPELGVGAVSFRAPNLVPKNYKIVAQTKGGVVAVPGNLVHTTPIGTGAPTPLAYKKAALVSEGRHPAQKLWTKVAPNRGVIRGANGGSAIISGLEVMKKANPDLLSAVVAHSMFNSILGT